MSVTECPIMILFLVMNLLVFVLIFLHGMNAQSLSTTSAKDNRSKNVNKIDKKWGTSSVCYIILNVFRNKFDSKCMHSTLGNVKYLLQKYI